MKNIFVNLKRFDVAKRLGGICQMDNSKEWIEWIMSECVKHNLGKLSDVEVTFLLPESLIIPAVDKLSTYPKEDTETIKIGCQGVYREDVIKGGNFGAFTTNRPAAAVNSLGCTASIIGHSEERKDKLGMISRYDPAVLEDSEKGKNAKNAIDSLINQEVISCLNSGMKVLMCVGETAEERGEGSFDEQKPRIEEVLKNQIVNGLKGVEGKNPQQNIAIGYEPIWAIGPGKVPPGAEYIGFVSKTIKDITKEALGFDPVVVYGGGLKEENAGMISKIQTIDGGLVALTKFSGEIGFYPEDLKIIIDKYLL